MLQIILPWPDMSLSPNRSKGVHWAQLSARRSRRRDDAYALAIQAIREAGYVAPDGDVALSICFNFPDKRRRDVDGCLSSCKHDLDGIAKALGIDDQRFNPITLRRDYGRKPGAVILVVG